MLGWVIIILLAAAAVWIGGVWIASYVADCEGFWKLSDNWSFTYEFRSGHANCFVTYYGASPGRQLLFIGRNLIREPPRWFSFGLYSFDKRGFLHSGILFPMWSLFALLAMYPTIAIIRGPLRRRRRQKQGLCIQCGYDLKGNVTGVCPECGGNGDTEPP